jgi:hypothetical protein
MNVMHALAQAPQRVITYTWLGSLALLFVTFLVMCVAVSRKYTHHSLTHSLMHSLTRQLAQC